MKLNAIGEPYIRLQGKWKPWTEINEILKFDVSRDVIVSRNNPEQGWNYISPDGLALKERIDFDELYPIEQLNEAEYQQLLGHARSFYNERNPDPEPTVVKDSIFQIISTYREDACGLL